MSMDLNKATVAEIAGMLQDLVYQNHDMDSYGLLAALTSSGWTYDERRFRDILHELSSRPCTVHFQDVDMYMTCRPVVLEAKLLNARRRANCYDCHFLHRCDYDYRLKKLYSQMKEYDRHAGYDKPVDPHDVHFCVLDPTLKIRLGMDVIPKQCPVNLALARQAEAAKEREDQP